jgi:hypothetical protein
MSVGAFSVSAFDGGAFSVDAFLLATQVDTGPTLPGGPGGGGGSGRPGIATIKRDYFDTRYEPGWNLKPPKKR